MRCYFWKEFTWRSVSNTLISFQSPLAMLSRDYTITRANTHTHTWAILLYRMHELSRLGGVDVSKWRHKQVSTSKLTLTINTQAKREEAGTALRLVTKVHSQTWNRLWLNGFTDEAYNKEICSSTIFGRKSFKSGSLECSGLKNREPFSVKFFTSIDLFLFQVSNRWVEKKP